MLEAEMKEIGGLIARVLDSKGAPDVIEIVHDEVRTLCRRFPIY
jgi:glycine/serine hydroxymethyltransferase